MKMISPYELSATEAGHATATANEHKTSILHSKAAAAHRAAEVQAYAMGMRDELAAHRVAVTGHLEAARQCDAGTPVAVAGTEAAAGAIEAGTSEGVTKAWIARHGAKSWNAKAATTAAGHADDKAFGSGTPEDHTAAYKAHDSAAEAHGMAAKDRREAGANHIADWHSKMEDEHAGLSKSHANMAEAAGNSGRPSTYHKGNSDRREMVHDAHADLVSKGMTPTHKEVAQHIHDNHGVKMGEDEVAHHLKSHLHAAAATRVSSALEAAASSGGWSLNDINSRINEAMRGVASLCQVPEAGAAPCNVPCGTSPWVCDVKCPAHEAGETWNAIVQGCDGLLYEVGFTLGADGSVAVAGEPKRVERTTDYDYVFNEPVEVGAAEAARAPAAGLEAAGTSEGVQKAWLSRKANATVKTGLASDASRTARITPSADNHRAAGDAHIAAAFAHKDLAHFASSNGDAATGDFHEAQAKVHKQKAIAHFDKAFDMGVSASRADSTGLEAAGTSEGAAKAWETRHGHSIPDITSDTYTKAEKVPKWNVPVSPLRDRDVGGKQLKQRLPHYSKADHEDAARAHMKAAHDSGEEWGKTQEAAHQKTFGKKPEFGDYKVSGVGREEYSAEHKDKLQSLARAQGQHTSAAHAHWKSAGHHGVTTEELKEKLSASRATETDHLEAGRSEDAARNAYQSAAAEAEQATGAVAAAHRKAHHKHSIAREHANSIGDTAAAMAHNEKAKRHLEKLDLFNQTT